MLNFFMYSQCYTVKFYHVGLIHLTFADDGKPATKIRTSCKEKRRTGDGTSIKESDSSDIQTNSDSDHEIVKTHDASKSAAQIRTSPAKRWTGEKGSDSSDIPKNSDDDRETVETHAASRRLDSTRSKQEEIPATASGRLMDLIALEMEREKMEARSRILGSGKSVPSQVSRRFKELEVKHRWVRCWM
jgi:hypothetical protein